MKQFEESEKVEYSKLNTTAEVVGSLANLKKLDEEKARKEEQLIDEKRKLMEMQVDLKKRKEKFLISERKYFWSQCVQIFLLSLILVSLLYFFC